jgi:excinuclease UvrABC nuclease subunit
LEINILLADSKILYLPKVSLETKELLPEYSGIYYVVDENKIVWYVGKAQNIRKRWQGKSHHRIYQLKQIKHKYFDIHYENISLSQLDLREKQQIAKHSPYLNNSPVKSKKFILQKLY